MKHSRNSRRIRTNVPPLCHSDRSASGVEESTTWDDEPPQDKTCHLGRFLDSLRSLGMTKRGVVPFINTDPICHAAERHIGRSLHPLPHGKQRTTLVAPRIVLCQFFTPFPLRFYRRIFPLPPIPFGGFPPWFGEVHIEKTRKKEILPHGLQNAGHQPRLYLYQGELF